MIMFGSFLPSMLVGFSTTNLTWAWEPTLSWNQLHSLTSEKVFSCYRLISTVAVWYRRYSVAPSPRQGNCRAVDVQPLSRVEIANHSGVGWCTTSDAFGFRKLLLMESIHQT